MSESSEKQQALSIPARDRILELAQTPEDPLAKLSEALRGGDAEAQQVTLELMGHQERPAITIQMAQEVGRRLVGREERLSVAESCTTGSVTGLLAGVPGASRYFAGSEIMYDHASKNSMPDFDVNRAIREGSVSQYVATQMAQYIKAKKKTQWGIGISGVAPTEGETSKKSGLVYIVIAGPQETICRQFNFSAATTRAQYQTLVGAAVLNLLNEQLSQE